MVIDNDAESDATYHANVLAGKESSAGGRNVVTHVYRLYKMSAVDAQT